MCSPTKTVQVLLGFVDKGSALRTDTEEHGVNVKTGPAGPQSQLYLAICRLGRLLRTPQGWVQQTLIQFQTLHSGFIFPFSFLLSLHWGWSLLLAKRHSELKLLTNFENS